MVKPGTVVTFDRVKQFIHIESLGQGGTGDTHLFKDETTDMFLHLKSMHLKTLTILTSIMNGLLMKLKFYLQYPTLIL